MKGDGFIEEKERWNLKIWTGEGFVEKKPTSSNLFCCGFSHTPKQLLQTKNKQGKTKTTPLPKTEVVLRELQLSNQPPFRSTPD